MSSTQDLVRALDTHLRTATFPIAVRMIAPGEEFPKRTKRPAADLHERYALCQAWNTARRFGWAMGLTTEDLSCPLAQIVWGFQPRVPGYVSGSACSGMYTATAEAGAETERQTDHWEHGQWAGVVFAPLHRASFEPHVVMVYGNSAQIMRLVTARLWKTGGRLQSSFSGRIDCADAVITAMKTEECQVILPCYGDRVFGQTQDDEMAFSIPARHIPTIIEGLQGTHEGGVRYPVPAFLRYTGEFPESYRKLEDEWKDSQDR